MISALAIDMVWCGLHDWRGPGGLRAIRLGQHAASRWHRSNPGEPGPIMVAARNRRTVTNARAHYPGRGRVAQAYFYARAVVGEWHGPPLGPAAAEAFGEGGVS